MAGEIKHDEIFEKGVLKPITKDVQKLINEFELLEKSIKDILEVQKEFIKGNKSPSNFKEVQSLNKAIADTVKSTEALTKVEKERLKLEEKLHEANSETIQDNEVLKVQLSEQKKVNKQLAKEKLNLVGAYEKESKRLIALRKEYKNLRVEEGKETKQTKELRKEIQKLDKELKDVDGDVGQFNRSVGDYGKAMEDALDNTKQWAVGLLSVGAALEVVNESISSSEEGSEAMRSTQAQLSAALNVTTNSLFNTANGLFGVVKGMFGGEQTAEEYAEAMAKLTGSFDGYAERIETSVDAADKAEKATIALEKASRGLREELVQVTGELDKQNLIAGDTTLSFEAQQEATKRVTKLNIERALIQRTIAAEELRIINERIEALGEGANTLELLNEQSEKQIQLTEVQNELTLAQADNEKVLREIQRDRFEKNLDFAIDAFDSTKTLLERQIALEGASFTERSANLERLKVLSDSSFLSQKQLTNQQVGFDLQLDQLVAIDDERVIREKIIDSNVTDEIVLTRILEIIRERRTVTQDIRDAELGITKALREEITEMSTLINELDQIQKQGRINRQQDDRQAIELRKEQLRSQAAFEITLLEEGSIKKQIIEAQLANDIEELNRQLHAKLDEQDKKAEDEADKRRKDRIQKVADFTNEVGNEVSEALSRQSDERQEAIDGEISRAQESITEQERIAREGGENILAQERARLEKAKLQKEREQKEQAQREQAIALAQVFLNSLASFRKAGEENAFNKALLETFAAKGIATILTGFYEGTDDTGSSGSMKDNHGVITGYTHKNEQVWSEADRGDVGFRTRDEIKDIINMHDNGMFMSPLAFRDMEAGKIINPSGVSMQPVIEQMKAETQELKSALKQYQSRSDMHYDSQNRMILRVIKDGMVKLYKSKPMKL
jgi:hypothetical protein